MKLRLTILLCFIAFAGYAQKQLQPYNYTIKEEGKEETIMIYASAEAVNSITFTLKNEKNETLKTKKDNGEEENISFKVFPFTENSFKGHFVDAINSIIEKDESNKEYSAFKTRFASANISSPTGISNDNGAIKDLRNIYQFFNALVITAFEYDNEPVAGILKYNQGAIVIKQNIDGLDTEAYFNRQAKLIRKLILDANGDSGVFKKALIPKEGKYKKINADDFLRFLSEKIDSQTNQEAEDEENTTNDHEKSLTFVIESLKAKIKDLQATNNNQEKNDNDELKALKDFIESLEENIVSSKNKLCLSNQGSFCNKSIERIVEKITSTSNKLLSNLNEASKNNNDIKSKIKEIETQLDSIIKSSDKSSIKKIGESLNAILKDLQSLNIPKNKKTDLTIEDDSYLMKLFDYHQKLKKGNNRNAKSVLKHHINKNIKEWYNTYQQLNFLKGSFANEYFKYKYRKNLNEFIVSEFDRISDILDNKISSHKTSIEKFEKDIEELKEKIEKIDVQIKDAKISKNTIAEADFAKQKGKFDSELKALENNKVQLEKEIEFIESTLKDYKKDKSNADNDSRVNQNKINFLIAKNRDKILDVPLWNLNVENIQIDFNDGFIEHITVTGKTVSPIIDKIAILNSIKKRHRKYYADVNIDGVLSGFYDEPFVKQILKDVMDVEFKFDNEFPIGFSSKTDFADLSNYSLYAFEGREKVFALPLTNVINLYIQHHQNDRLDFSPKDQTISLPTPDDPNNERQIELKKEKSSKILNAKVFTDFNGFKESEPNGLVQFEVEKQVPLWTKRMHLGTGRSSNFGLFNYAVFNLTWAKLNEEDRELQVLKAERFINNESQIDNYITYLDLIRFENVSVGVDLNIASFDFPLIKTRVELNGGVHYGRVKVVDDVPNPTEENAEATIRQLEKDVNMIRIYPDVIVRIRPEERFGGYLRFRAFRTIVPDNEEFFTVYSANDFLENSNRQNALEDQRWLQRYELGAFYTPSADSDNKFFFRYRYTNTSEWETNGYSEIQLGYQIYLKF